MNTAQPALCAKIAKQIYTINNDLALKKIHSEPEFADDSSVAKLMEANLGTRSSFLWKKRDQFAVAIRS